MDVTRTHTFDATPEQCWAMFGDPTSHVNKFTEMGHHGVEVVDEERSEDRLRIVITREVDIDGIPGFAKKFVKPRNTVVSTDEWNDRGDGTYGGTFTIDTKGVPMKLTGDTSIEATGDGRTLYTVVIHLSVSVPLVGGKLAEFGKGIALKQLDEEFAVGDRWLASH